MKDFFIKIITGNRARIKVVLTGIVTWCIMQLITESGIGGETIASWGAAIGIGLTPTGISVVAGVIASYLLEAVTAKMHSTAIKQIQVMLPQDVTVDGYAPAGGETMTAIKETTKAATTPGMAL